MNLKILGSVSPFCYKDSNGVVFLLTSENENILIDCGSGICKLLDIPNVFENLTIFISHLHRDHFCELLSLSYASYIYFKNAILKNKIKVYIPNENEDLLVTQYIKDLEDDSYFEFIRYDENTMLNIGNVNISFKESVHGMKTYHMKFEKNGKTIVYSADTGYADNKLEDFSRNANLLICESTYLKNQVKPKDVHLNTVEASFIARDATVEKLMLCHFWPTIDKNLYLEEAKENFVNTVCAVENSEYNF